MKFIVVLATLFFIYLTPVYSQGTLDWSTQQPGRCVKTVNTNPGGLGYQSFDDVASIQGFECLFYNVLQVIVALAGIAFLFMFISGGFKYLFSSGEQKAVAAASSTLTMAFIGLIGIVASWLILSFIQNFTGVNITEFIIPG